MPSMSFQDFRSGVDRRKSQQIVDQRGLYDCKNAFVNNGFAIKKRSVYASAKHALHGFNDALRAEVFENNIKVSEIKYLTLIIRP